MDTSASSTADNLGKYWGYKHFADRYNGLVKTFVEVTGSTNPFYMFDTSKMRDPGDVVWLSQKQIFDMIRTELSLLIAYMEDTLGVKEDEILNLRNFLQANLRRAIFDQPEREAQVQDVVEQILIGRGLEKGLDYDREVGRVKVSIKEVVPDFIFPRLSLVLEVKLLKDSNQRGRLIDEINADISSYAKQYSHILFLIYDLGVIRDEREFRSGLEAADAVGVLVVKH